MGICLAAGTLAATAVRAIRMLRLVEGGGDADAGEAAPASDRVLPYARPREARRVSLRGVNLAAICVAQGTFGLAVLGWCKLMLERRYGPDFWFHAFLVFAALAGVGQLMAAALVLLRGWAGERAARRGERWAGGSLLPVFGFGATLAASSGVALVRGTDGLAGIGIGLGVAVCVITGVFVVLSLAAVRMLRPAEG
jgi:hypothetical protein